MNYFKNKKIYLIAIFIFVFLSLFSFNKAYADYYYWVDSIHSGETGKWYTDSGFSTKQECEEQLKLVHKSHKTSGSCYEGSKDASITSFSPTTGKPYDTVTIIGKNLRSIKSIYFNNQISTFDGKTSGSSTEIKVTIPNGATTGPIIINTEFRGVAKSKTNFNINNTDLYWWYLNSTGQIRGVGGHHSLDGFKDKESCELSKEAYIKELNSMSIKLSDCFQKTTKEVEQQIKGENNGGTPIDISPGDSPLATAVSPIYKLLAPIGKITQIETNNIGTYFNILFKIAIGLCAALAVIMLVIYGIAYMGEESVFGKANAKDKMTSALLGLGLAIGSYVLLNTIDPNLTGKGGLNVNQVSISMDKISTEDTSTGSSNLCISRTNPPDYKKYSPSSVKLNTEMSSYIKERDTLTSTSSNKSLSTGIKLLITAQASFEGFYSGSKSYKTNNPGNIGNVDNGGTKTFKTLRDGIVAQYNMIDRVSRGVSPSYRINDNYPCALNEKYQGYLYQYLRIYATGARTNNNYLNYVIGYFKSQGKTITATTTLEQIANLK